MNLVSYQNLTTRSYVETCTNSFVSYMFVEPLVEVSHFLKVFIAFKTLQPNPCRSLEIVREAPDQSPVF